MKQEPASAVGQLWITVASHPCVSAFRQMLDPGPGTHVVQSYAPCGGHGTMFEQFAGDGTQSFEPLPPSAPRNPRNSAAVNILPTEPGASPARTSAAALTPMHPTTTAQNPRRHGDMATWRPPILVTWVTVNTPSTFTI